MNHLPTTMKSLPKVTILYAEDDVDDQLYLCESFANYSSHVQVMCVHNGEQAVDYLASLPEDAPSPCLIILDMNMPRKNGKETLLEIRKMDRYEDIPVVMFTTSSQPLDQSFAERNKAGFITKPIDGKQMEYIVDRFIEHCTDEVKRQLKK